MSQAQTNMEVIDFHCHHVPSRFELTAAKAAPASQRARWDAIARKLSDEDLLLKDVRNGLLAGRVVNIPAQLIADADGHVPHETIMAINDSVAELTARHPGRIHGLASVDVHASKFPDPSKKFPDNGVREFGLKSAYFIGLNRGR